MKMRFLLIWSFCLGLFATLPSCYKDVLCPGCDTDQGIIVDFEAGPSADCQALLYSQDQKLVITNDSTYQALASGFNTNSGNCDSLAFRSVDFAQYSVLSMSVDGSGCSRSFCPQVVRDDVNQEYRFTIKVIECGGCEPLLITRFWVVVPRLPEGYGVSFETLREQY